MAEPARFHGLHCTIEIHRLGKRVVRVELAGTDTGEFGEAPFAVLDQVLSDEPHIELFIDARAGKAASIDVSAQWATWLRANRAHLELVHMLTATRFIALSADMVRRFAELGETMRLYTERMHFEAAQVSSLAKR